MWHSNDPYRKVIWQCNNKFKNEKKCTTPALAPETIQQMFLKAYNELMGSRDELIRACGDIYSYLTDCTDITESIKNLNDEIRVVAELVNKCIAENSGTEQSQTEYHKKYNSLVDRYEKAVDKLKELEAEKDRRENRGRELHIFIESIKVQPLATDTWNDELWLGLVDHATVHSAGSITFKFKNETEITVGAE